MIHGYIVLTFKNGTKLSYANKNLYAKSGDDGAEKPNLKYSGIPCSTYTYTGFGNDRYEDQTHTGEIKSDYEYFLAQVGGTGLLKYPEDNETTELVRSTGPFGTYTRFKTSASDLASVAIVEDWKDYPDSHNRESGYKLPKSHWQFKGFQETKDITDRGPDFNAGITYDTGYIPQPQCSLVNGALVVINASDYDSTVSSKDSKGNYSVYGIKNGKKSATTYFVVSYAATPTATPEAGAVSSGDTVTLATTTEGATIYYTDDGSTPTTSSTAYTTPIAITSAKTIKAIAVKNGMANSEVGSFAYTIKAAVATPTITPTSASLAYDADITIACSTSGATIHYTTDGSVPTAESPVYTDKLKMAGDITIKAMAVKEGMDNSAVKTKNYTLAKTTAPKLVNKITSEEFDPEATYIYTSDKFILSADSGASIYYTIDGSTPTTSSTLYSGEDFFLKKDVTIKAIAVKEHYKNSDVYSATPASVKAADIIVVGANEGEIQIAQPGDQMTFGNTLGSNIDYYYTEDGSEPTTESTKIVSDNIIPFVDTSVTEKTFKFKGFLANGEADPSNVVTIVATLAANEELTKEDPATDEE